jgi:hypothetical protein
MVSDDEIDVKIVRKLLKRRVVGAKKERFETVIARTGLPSHAEGRAKDRLEELLGDPESPVRGYGGGARRNVRLVGVDTAVEFLRDHGEEPPFGFRD